MFYNESIFENELPVFWDKLWHSFEIGLFSLIIFMSSSIIWHFKKSAFEMNELEWKWDMINLWNIILFEV